MTKQDKNKALDKLNSIQRKLNYEGNQITRYEEKFRVAYNIETITYTVLGLEITDFKDFKEIESQISNKQWRNATIEYIVICKKAIRKAYKLQKFRKEIHDMDKQDIKNNFSKIVRKIYKLKGLETPTKKEINNTMKNFNYLSEEQRHNHRMNIIERLITNEGDLRI